MAVWNNHLRAGHMSRAGRQEALDLAWSQHKVLVEHKSTLPACLGAA